MTEIKNVTYDTVDCGGMLNEWKETIVQIWENTTPDGNYVDTTKALEIAMKVDSVRPIVKDTEVKFEYGNSLLYLKNIGIDNYKEKWLVDNNSKIFYENTQVGKISKDIVKIIYKKSLN